MNRRVIALDCDDVIIVTAPAILQNYNERFGTKLELKDYYSDYTTGWATDRSTAVRRVDEFLKTKEYQDLEPLQEAIDAIAMLSKYHELHIVTGRADFLANSTRRVLQQYFPDTFRSIAFTNFFGQASRPKAQVCQELGADLLIDDHLHHAQTVAACGIDVLLFGNYPWNQTDSLPSNIKRVPNWKVVVAELVRDE